jgi:hypothetical protein
MESFTVMQALAKHNKNKKQLPHLQCLRRKSMWQIVLQNVKISVELFHNYLNFLIWLAGKHSCPKTDQFLINFVDGAIWDTEFFFYNIMICQIWNCTSFLNQIQSQNQNATKKRNKTSKQGKSWNYSELGLGCVAVCVSKPLFSLILSCKLLLKRGHL